MSRDVRRDAPGAVETAVVIGIPVHPMAMPGTVEHLPADRPRTRVTQGYRVSSDSDARRGYRHRRAATTARDVWNRYCHAPYDAMGNPGRVMSTYPSDRGQNPVRTPAERRASCESVSLRMNNAPVAVDISNSAEPCRHGGGDGLTTRSG